MPAATTSTRAERLAARLQLIHDLAARLSRDGACVERTRLWLQKESEHASATTSAEARLAAEPLLAVCAQCPVLQACGTWAGLDQYTGIAAGTAWYHGRIRAGEFVPYRQRRGKGSKTGRRTPTPSDGVQSAAPLAG